MITYYQTYPFMEDDDLKVDPVFASHNIMIKDCEKQQHHTYDTVFLKLYCNFTPQQLKCFQNKNRKLNHPDK